MVDPEYVEKLEDEAIDLIHRASISQHTKDVLRGMMNIIAYQRGWIDGAEKAIQMHKSKPTKLHHTGPR